MVEYRFDKDTEERLAKIGYFNQDNTSQYTPEKLNGVILYADQGNHFTIQFHNTINTMFEENCDKSFVEWQCFMVEMYWKIRFALGNNFTTYEINKEE